jgi:hypothetical protein
MATACTVARNEDLGERGERFTRQIVKVLKRLRL